MKYIEKKRATGFYRLEGSEKKVPYRTGQGDLVVGTVFAKDEKHAVKIVNEKRIQLLAEGKIRQGPA